MAAKPLSRLLTALISLLPLSLPAAEIDLSKPVSQSLPPDVLYWSFDGGEVGLSRPNPAVDWSGNNLNAALLGLGPSLKPDYVEGRFGTAISVEGTPKQEPHLSLVEIKPDQASRLSLKGKSFTIGLWLRLPAPEQERRQIVLFRSQGWYWAIHQRSEQGWDTVFIAKERAYSDAKVRIDDDRWHHLAVTVEPRDGGLLAVNFYWDGHPMGSERVIEGELPEHTALRRGMLMGNNNLLENVHFDDVFITSGVHTFKPAE